MRTPWSFESLWSQGCSHQCTNIAFWNNITWLRATNSLHDLHIVMFLHIEVVPVLSMSTMLDSSSCWDWALFSVRTYSNLRDSISSFTKVGFFSRQNTYTSCPAREYWNIEVRNWNILTYHSPIRKSSHWPTTSLTAASNVPDYATKLSPRKTGTLVIQWLKKLSTCLTFCRDAQITSQLLRISTGHSRVSESPESWLSTNIWVVGIYEESTEIWLK